MTQTKLLLLGCLNDTARAILGVVDDVALGYMVESPGTKSLPALPRGVRPPAVGLNGLMACPMLLRGASPAGGSHEEYPPHIFTMPPLVQGEPAALAATAVGEDGSSSDALKL